MKMESAPNTVKSLVQNLIPASILDDVILFQITNRYVRWTNRPEIVVVTKHGEIIELNNRQITSSYVYESNLKPDAFRLHFNKSKKHPDYVIKASDKVFIIGRPLKDHDEDTDDDEKEDESESIDINEKFVSEMEKMDIDEDEEDVNKLKLLAKFEEVTRLEDDDQECCGRSKLKLWCYDDVLPTVLDSHYRPETRNSEDDDEEENAKDERVMSILMENLREAKLNTARNRKILETKQLFRRQVSHSISDDRITEVDKCPIVKEEPWYKVNNGKMVIGTTLRNTSKSSIEFMDLCLIDTVQFETPSFILTFYKKDDNSPLHWKKCTGSLEADESVTLTCVTKIPQFSANVHEYRGFLHYKYENNILFLLIDINIKASDIIQDHRNSVLCNITKFNIFDVLSILVTSETKCLDIHFINDVKTDMKTFYIKKLEYECNNEVLPNTFKHSKSPCHLLHGTVIYTELVKEYGPIEKIYISYKNTDQLLLLINLIYDLIPTRIAILPSKQNEEAYKCMSIFSKSVLTEAITEAMSTEGYLSEATNQFIGNELYNTASTLYEQMALVSEHIEKCIEVMSSTDSGNRSANATSMEIDLLSLGQDVYKELWKKLQEKIIHV